MAKETAQSKLNLGFLIDPISGGAVEEFGGGDDGGGGPFEQLTAIGNEFNNWLSSTFGAAVVAAFSAQRYAEEFAKFAAQADELTKNAITQLERTTGFNLGAPEQIRVPRSDLRGEQAVTVQNRIDAGESSEAWLNKWTELVDVDPEFPSATEFAFETAELGEALGADLFDPGKATKRFTDAFGDVVEGFEALPGQVGAANERVTDLFGDLTSQFRGGAADINRGFEDILGTATGLVSQLGGTARRDINRRFDEAGGAIEASLGQRGLSGTTLDTSAALGVERERSTALLGLEEQLTAQQLGVQETFGLAGLSAEERLLAGGINLGGAQASALQFGNQLSAQTSLASLSALGNIAGAEVGAFDQAATQRFNAFLASRGLPIQVQLASAGLGLGLFRDQPLVAPTPNAPPTIIPPAR